MRFFTPPTDARFYAGVDPHARSLFLWALDPDGQACLARNLTAAPAGRRAPERSPPVLGGHGDPGAGI